MARQKRSSEVLEKAARRADALGSINEKLDLGNGLTLANFQKKVEEMRDKQTVYNRRLSGVDQAYNDMLDTEKDLAQLTERMLTAVAAIYGRDSNEYEMAGGTRRKERRRRKATAQTSEQPVVAVQG
jgi:hypothetical protein